MWQYFHDFMHDEFTFVFSIAVFGALTALACFANSIRKV